MRISIVGAGRVATHLAKILSSQHQMVQIFSPTLLHAQQLAKQVQASAVARIEDLDCTVDLLMIAVSDRAISTCIQQLAQQFNQTLIVHTSGSTHLDILTEHYARAGVFYPLQTFSLDCEIDWAQTPLFIETARPEDLAMLKGIADGLSQRIYQYNSAQRLSLHMAAVFACNFSNYCYDMAAQITTAEQVDFSLLHPLILETAKKATQNSPEKMQTGPAVRQDQHILAMHQQMLEQAQRPDLEAVYKRMSEEILKRHHPEAL